MNTIVKHDPQLAQCKWCMYPQTDAVLTSVCTHMQMLYIRTATLQPKVGGGRLKCLS